jgi:hypothetical protein
MATIGWIDFSKQDRNKVKQLMSLIRPEGQLDELGVGYLRDALANKLFPGISTIQTRAKYFFIIPNILRDYLRLSVKERRTKTPKVFLREREHLVKNKLRELYNSEEGRGIIGVTLSHSKYIKRNPSEIYWNGLKVFGFMNSEGTSLENYLRNAAKHQPVERMQKDEEADDADSEFEDIFKIKTPVSISWYDNLSIELERSEAEFFHEQILSPLNHINGSIVHELFLNDDLQQYFLAPDTNFQSFIESSLDLDINKEVKDLLILAYNFAELMEGVHLLYNHLLQKHFFAADYDDRFEDAWINWRNGLKNRMIDFDSFNPDKIFEQSGAKRINTELFIKQWWQYVYNSTDNSTPSLEMYELVRQREKVSKGKKSRLSKPVSSNEDVELHKRIGLSLFQYRFFNARTIVKDILTGINS